MENNQPSKQHFYAHGKFLISGEYLVLRGAKALAVPLKYGQSLYIETSKGEPQLIWKAHYPGQNWFEVEYHTGEFVILKTDNPELAKRLQNILIEARKMNPEFLTGSSATTAIATLNFPPQWGIGSSSSLLANIGHWAAVDPYELNSRIFGGSGYDIAAALSPKPIIYQLVDGVPTYETVDFFPPFSQNLYMVYQNQKQSSKTAVRNFANTVVPQKSIEPISEITLKMATAKNLEDFMALMSTHENLMAEVLQQTPVQRLSFPDFEGSIKSMGAWGGDFLLVASEKSWEYVLGYFNNKGFDTVFGWDEMVL